MSPPDPTRPTRCAICGTEGNAADLYPASFGPGDLNPATFSARRLPDRVHYRLVRCLACGLVRSDPVAGPEVLAELYGRSSFDYAGEVPNLRATYGRYLDRLGPPAAGSALLEIGCGNGFMLEEALRRGWAEVRGVEPSRAAVAQAAPAVRDAIMCDVMRPGLFHAETFDAVCLFQVLDHVADPAELLAACWSVLRPGGSVLCLNHDIEALSARVLGERSPIVDIEHTYLYSPRTLRSLFAMHGFQPREAGAARNRCSLGHLTRLLPLPPAAKRAALASLTRARLAGMSVWLPLGNVYIIATKPATGAPGQGPPAAAITS